MLYFNSECLNILCSALATLKRAESYLGYMYISTPHSPQTLHLIYSALATILSLSRPIHLDLSVLSCPSSAPLQISTMQYPANSSNVDIHRSEN
jgi:hypothetical protein